jgi:hypothetical protein
MSDTAGHGWGPVQQRNVEDDFTTLVSLLLFFFFSLQNHGIDSLLRAASID